MFTQHRIEAFQKTVGMLPDMPNMEAGPLKAWFDSAPEELRHALNGVCDDGATLAGKVDGIIEGSFGGAVSESMLDAPLAAKLNGKAEGSAQTALAGRTDTLESEMATVLAALPLKSGVVFGSYTGDRAASRDIVLGFRPTAVLLICCDNPFFINSSGIYSFYGGLFSSDVPLPAKDQSAAMVIENGFRVYYGSKTTAYVVKTCTNDTLLYHYLAIR